MPLGKALDVGLGALGTLLDCARNVLGRLGTQVAPLARQAADRLSPTAPAPPAGESPQGARVGGPQDEVEKAKYYLGPRPAAAERLLERETAELPRAYGHDRIVLLPRDPWWLLAYWEVTPNTRIQALRTLGAEAEGAREVLRVYDVTFVNFTGDNAWLSFDLELPPGADHFYVNVGRPAASYCVEIGLRAPTGRFFPLARSNSVTTPRSAPSPDTTVRWVRLRARELPVETNLEWAREHLPTRGAPARAATSFAPAGSSDLLARSR
jgi:hypothetical protein